ncbi:hypothetical protein V2A60_008041 [Cordyceps javanica]
MVIRKAKTNLRHREKPLKAKNLTIRELRLLLLPYEDNETADVVLQNKENHQILETWYQSLHLKFRQRGIKPAVNNAAIIKSIKSSQLKVDESVFVRLCLWEADPRTFWWPEPDMFPVEHGSFSSINAFRKFFTNSAIHPNDQRRNNDRTSLVADGDERFRSALGIFFYGVIPDSTWDTDRGLVQKESDTLIQHLHSIKIMTPPKEYDTFALAKKLLDFQNVMFWPEEGENRLSYERCQTQMTATEAPLGSLTQKQPVCNLPRVNSFPYSAYTPYQPDHNNNTLSPFAGLDVDVSAQVMDGTSYQPDPTNNNSNPFAGLDVDVSAQVMDGTSYQPGPTNNNSNPFAGLDVDVSAQVMDGTSYQPDPTNNNSNPFAGLDVDVSAQVMDGTPYQPDPTNNNSNSFSGLFLEGYNGA